MQDLTGKKFGCWTVLSFVARVSYGYLWRCKCDCGNVAVLQRSNLLHRPSKHCGACRSNDLSGRVIGNYTVLRRQPRDRKRNARYLCRCKCGCEKEISHTQLTRAIVTGSNYCKNCLPKNTPTECLFKRYRHNASSRGISWQLSLAQFSKIALAPCVYCGHLGLKKYERHLHKINGVDRVNSAEGYSVANCVPACGVCNRMKSDMPRQDFLNHIKQILRHTTKESKTCQK